MAYQRGGVVGGLVGDDGLDDALQGGQEPQLAVVARLVWRHELVGHGALVVGLVAGPAEEEGPPVLARPRLTCSDT